MAKVVFDSNARVLLHFCQNWFGYIRSKAFLETFHALNVK